MLLNVFSVPIFFLKKFKEIIVGLGKSCFIYKMKNIEEINESYKKSIQFYNMFNKSLF